MKVVIIPYINTEYKRICLNILLFITKLITENTIFMEKENNLWFLKNRLRLYDVLGCVPNKILTILVRTVNIYTIVSILSFCRVLYVVCFL